MSRKQDRPTCTVAITGKERALELVERMGLDARTIEVQKALVEHNATKSTTAIMADQKQRQASRDAVYYNHLYGLADWQQKAMDGQLQKNSAVQEMLLENPDDEYLRGGRVVDVIPDVYFAVPIEVSTQPWKARAVFDSAHCFSR